MSRPGNLFQIDFLENRLMMAVNPVIKLLAGQNTIPAGQAIHAHAVPVPFQPSTDLGGGNPSTSRYDWDFGDTTASARYNQIPGFNAAHVYEEPGTYTLTLKVTNASGEVGTTTTQINVVPFEPSRYIFVDTAPGIALPPNSFLATSFSQINSLLTDNSVVSFRRGVTFTPDVALNINKSNVLVTSFGDADLPTIELPANASQFQAVISTGASARNVNIRNLSFDVAGAIRLGETFVLGGVNVTVQDCRIDNAQTAFNSSSEPRGLLVMDNQAGTLAAYFAYVKGTDQAYLGNTVAESQNQHNIRIYGERILCYKNDLTNIPSGSSLHTLRVNEGSFIYWSNNILRGGFVYIGPLGPDSAGSFPGGEVHDVIMENNKMLQIARNYNGNNRINILAGAYNVMLRNNYIESTDAAAITVDTFRRMTWQPEQMTGITNPTAPITVTKIATGISILNNTITNPDLGNGTQAGTKGAMLQVNGTTTGSITLRNNLYIAPNLDTTAFTSAAIRVQDRSDLQGFTTLASGGGIAGNVWPLNATSTTRGVHYVPNAAGATASYRTPSEWVVDFPGYVGADRFANIRPTDLSANLSPGDRSVAARAGVPTPGVFVDLYNRNRAGAEWSAGAVTTDALILETNVGNNNLRGGKRFVLTDIIDSTKRSAAAKGL